MKRSGPNLLVNPNGWLLIGALGLLSGCATRPDASSPGGQAPSLNKAETGESVIAPAGHRSVVVASEPGGAVVVVDGRPIGRAPQAVSLPVNGSGFLARPVSVKVRFVSDDANGGSQTAEVMLTPLDRAPARLDFTPQGARRTLVL